MEFVLGREELQEEEEEEELQGGGGGGEATGGRGGACHVAGVDANHTRNASTAPPTSGEAPPPHSSSGQGT